MRGVMLSLVVVLCACGPSAQVAKQSALDDTKAYVASNIDALVTASTALCAAAPAPDADGWNATNDATAVANMKAEWKKARAAYEHVEGSIAVLFGGLDVSTDERYDGFIENAGDDNLFDDQGVTGVHALERILWSDSIPQSVIDFESTLPHYKAAAFPATQQEADDFKNKLCARLVTDVTSMKAQYAPLALDTAAAFRGVIGSMKEQVEKTTLASTGQEESRYAQTTLDDMRANLEGGRVTFDAFSPWIEVVADRQLVTDISAGFGRVAAGYAEVNGAAIPAPPATWSATNPSAEDRATPFGKLYTMLEVETALTGNSVVAKLNTAADKLGIPQLPEE